MHKEGQPGTDLHLDSLYLDEVMNHAHNPRGTAPVVGASVEHEGYNPACGDELSVALKITGSATEARLEALQVLVHGCTICRASGSLAAELLSGRALAEVRSLLLAFTVMLEPEGAEDPRLGPATHLAGVRRFPVRLECASLPWTTLIEALEMHNG